MLGQCNASYYIILYNEKGDLLLCGVIIGIPDCPAPQGHHHPGTTKLSEIGSICVNRFFYISVHIFNFLICSWQSCWMKLNLWDGVMLTCINTSAIKPEEVTMHWSSTQGTKQEDNMLHMSSNTCLLSFGPFVTLISHVAWYIQQ